MDRRTVVKMAGFVALIALPALMWYGLLADSFMLVKFYNMLLDLVRELLSASPVVGDPIPVSSPYMRVTLQDALNAFYWVLYILLSAYGLYTVMRREDMREKWDVRYLILASPFLFLSFLTFFDSNLFTNISKDRLFHICLLFMAPLAVCGGIHAFRGLRRKHFSRRSHTRAQQSPMMAFASIMVVGFLLSTGIFAFVTGEPLPIELDVNSEGRAYYGDGEYVAANFTADKKGDSRYVFADAHRAYLYEMVGGLYCPLEGRTSVITHSVSDLYYLLGTENLEGRIWLEDPQKWRENKTCINIDDNFKRSLLVMDKIYASQEAELYYKKFWGPI